MFFWFLFFKYLNHKFLFNLRHLVDLLYHTIKYIHNDISKIWYPSSIIKWRIIQCPHKISLKQWNKLFIILHNIILFGNYNFIPKIISHLINRFNLHSIRYKSINIIIKLIKRLLGHIPQGSFHQILDYFEIFLHFWSIIRI